MVYNDTTAEKNGVLQQCEINLFGDAPFGQVTDNPNRLAIMTNYVNEALSRYGTIALMSDYNWQWDDRNRTDLPIGTTALTLGQQDYSFAAEHVVITGVELKDTAGNWYALEELDESLFAQNDVSITAWQSGANGIPYQYRKVANSILLYPAPNYSQANSLKVHFKRAPSYYATTDTTKVQGFTDLHATYLSDYASWKYAMSRSMPLADRLRQEVAIWEEKRIPELYSRRSAEHSKIIRSAFRNSR